MSYVSVASTVRTPHTYSLGTAGMIDTHHHDTESYSTADTTSIMARKLQHKTRTKGPPSKRSTCHHSSLLRVDAAIQK